QLLGDDKPLAHDRERERDEEEREPEREPEELRLMSDPVERVDGDERHGAEGREPEQADREELGARLLRAWRDDARRPRAVAPAPPAREHEHEPGDHSVA